MLYPSPVIAMAAIGIVSQLHACESGVQEINLPSMVDGDAPTSEVKVAYRVLELNPGQLNDVNGTGFFLFFFGRIDGSERNARRNGRNGRVLRVATRPASPGVFPATAAFGPHLFFNLTCALFFFLTRAPLQLAKPHTEQAPLYRSHFETPASPHHTNGSDTPTPCGEGGVTPSANFLRSPTPVQ